MIALLPVRGWASDVMSVASAAQQLSIVSSTTELVATHALQTRAKATFDGYFEGKPASSMPWDCPMGARDGASATQAQSDLPLKPLCHGCNSCQLCMALATGLSLPVVEATVTAYPVPVPRNSGFSSVTLQRGLKPPIA